MLSASPPPAALVWRAGHGRGVPPLLGSATNRTRGPCCVERGLMRPRKSSSLDAVGEAVARAAGKVSGYRPTASGNIRDPLAPVPGLEHVGSRLAGAYEAWLTEHES
jgi:hypothetical protein